jgi:ketosteroid isomerase-like protein
MSQENVEIVRSLQPNGVDLVEVFEAQAANELASVVGEFVHEDLEVQFIARGGTLEGTAPYRGLEGFAQAWREWLQAWTSYRIDAENFIDDGDRVVVLVRAAARTARDDVVMHHTPGAVYTIRNGKVASIRFYFDRSEALEAVGLSEQDAHADS